MDKTKIREILEQIAVLLELKGENQFKSRAYYNAARAIDSLNEDIEEIIKSGKLLEIKGIGEGIGKKIIEFVKTGKLKYYEDLKKSIPAGLIEMLDIPTLGPKRIKIIYEKLGVSNIGELEYACNENRLVELEGFGEKIQQNILKGIEYLKKNKDKHLYNSAVSEALKLLTILRKCKVIIRSDIAGSLRRKKEIIGDIDILASSDNNKKAMDCFVKIPFVESITGRGDTKTSVVLKTGINADLRIVKDEEYPYALHHFTGSKEHNTAMRSRAKKMDIKMNEYGLFKNSKLIKCRDEEEIFQKLGMEFIPPELRENTGEIETAEKNELPKLIEESDIKGVLHVHTNSSDGTLSLREMVKAAKELKYQYIGISDHSKSAYYANGLSEQRIREQHAEIDKLNREPGNIPVLKGIESDILPDGSMDYSDDVLSSFDFVIASIHSRFNMGEKEMANRIIKAMKNKYVNIIGHLTGRLLLAREAYKIDVQRVIDAAANLNVVIEINSHPQRLDLDWRFCKYAKQKKVKMSINPDAHSIEGLSNIGFGVGIARKGWLEAPDIINTFSFDELLNFFKTHRKARIKK